MEQTIEQQQNTALEAAKTQIGNEFVNEQKIQQLFETYENTLILDNTSFEFMKSGLKDLKKISSGIEKKRKELTEPALRFQRELKKHSDCLREKLEPLKIQVEQKIKDFEDKEKAEKRKIFNERCDKLTANGFQFIGGFYVCEIIRINPDDIMKWTDADVDFYINKGKEEIQRRQAEEQKIKNEREALAKERAELAAQREALEKQYGKLIPDPEPIIEFEQPKHEPQPEPEPQPQQEPEPQPETTSQDGFETFRKELLKLLSGNQKFTRATLKDWAENLKIEECLEN